MKAFFSVAAVMMLVGCAAQENVTTSSADMLALPAVVFPYEAEITGMLSYTTNKACSESDFLLYAREKENVHRVIDVVMKSTCNPSQRDASGRVVDDCSCTYSGIGIKYKFNEKLKVEKNEDAEIEKSASSTEEKIRTRVKLNSDPQGAEVYVNGRQMKNPTPSILLFNKGKNNIRMTLGGVQRDTTVYIDGSESFMEIDMSF